MMRPLKSIISFKKLGYRHISREISAYGYKFSVFHFYQLLGGSTVGVIALGYLFGLRGWYLVVLALAVIVAVPFLVLATYRDLYEQQRFDDLNNYLEQLLMSFKRHGNLLMALQDSREIFTQGKMPETLDQAIARIEEGGGVDLYDEALGVIEAKYPSAKAAKIHQFLIQIENWGGEFQATLDLLANERMAWSKRIYQLKNSQKQIEISIYISVVMATVIAALMGFVMPSQFNVFELGFIKLISLGYLVTMIGLVVIVRRTLTGRYFEEIQMIESDKIEKYRRIMAQPNRFEAKDLAMVVILLGAKVFFWLSGHPNLGLACAGLAGYGGYRSFSLKKRIKKKMTASLELAFPQWLLEVSLLLQNNNVYIAIEQSLPLAPAVLQEPIAQLLLALEQQPDSMRPYNDFLAEYKLVEVKSMMRSLFALDHNGNGEDSRFLNGLIERNNQLVDQSEQIYHENQIAYVSIFQFVPMLLASLKLMADMFGFVILLLGNMQVAP